MGNEVNEIINNLCNKLGVAVSELIPALARYQIAHKATLCITFIILLYIGIRVVIPAAYNKLDNRDGSPWQDDIPIISLFIVIVLVIIGIVLIITIPDLVGWIASPTGAAFKEITKVLS